MNTSKKRKKFTLAKSLQSQRAAKRDLCGCRQQTELPVNSNLLMNTNINVDCAAKKVRPTHPKRLAQRRHFRRRQRTISHLAPNLSIFSIHNHWRVCHSRPTCAWIHRQTARRFSRWEPIFFKLIVQLTSERLSRGKSWSTNCCLIALRRVVRWLARRAASCGRISRSTSSFMRT